MSRRPRMKRWPLLLDPRTRANLDRRAAAHGVGRPAYVRSLINGERPGAEPGTQVAQADAWWDSRSPARRVAIWKNHVASTSRVSTENDDQPSIFETEDGAE